LADGYNAGESRNAIVLAWARMLTWISRLEETCAKVFWRLVDWFCINSDQAIYRISGQSVVVRAGLPQV